MAQSTRRAKDVSEDVPTLLGEIARMLVAYVKQETLEPIKGIGRFLAYGAAAMLLAALGILLLILGGLRLLQTETGSAFRGHLKFIPYLIALAGCCIVAVAALKAASGPKKDR